MSASATVSYDVFEGSAADGVWRDVAELFVETFSAPPYLEDPEELATITQWGPAQLGHDGGRLVIARCDEAIVGFALAHGLRADPAWLGILAQLVAAAPASPAAPADPASPTALASTALAQPADAVVVHELAVREGHRGRGIAGSCLMHLLRDRPESRTFIGVYERATDAASMYRHWGLADIGNVPMPGDAIALHVLTAQTSGIVSRIARS